VLVENSKNVGGQKHAFRVEKASGDYGDSGDGRRSMQMFARKIDLDSEIKS
jgi:hypothetical protein